MARRHTSNYKPASARPAGTRPARLRLRLPRVRRQFALIGALGVAILIAAAALGGALLQAKIDHDWTSVASVNGHSISRESLRGRVAVLTYLAQERDFFIGKNSGSGLLTPEEASALRTQAATPLADVVTAARESLIDDELARQLAAREGVATPPNPDPWAEAGSFVSGDLARQVRVVRFGLPTAASAGSSPNAGASSSPSPAASPAPASTPWPAASAANVGAATDRLRAELAARTKVETIVAGLHDGGWTVLGEDVAVSADGVPADASLQLDPVLAAGAIGGKTGDILGPGTDEYGRVNMGLLLAPADTSWLANLLGPDADKAKLDTSALADWANGQALKRTLAAALLDRWQTKGVTLAHFRELVIGNSPDSTGTAGPWVELSGLALDRLTSVSPTAIAGGPPGLDLHPDKLPGSLRALGPADRSALFGKLVAAANAASGDASKTSGEIGFATKDGLVPDLGKAAFDSKVKTGDILGPITTSAGPQLFLVEARYSGPLDDRAQAALREVRADPKPDLLAYTSRFSPADAALARDAGWRAEPEFGTDEPVRGALFDTAIGALSDPFALDGKLALAIVDERKTALPDARTSARLRLDGYATWFAGERSKATITRSTNPLPELGPSASPSPTLALPTMPGLQTPELPSIPGAAPTPVKTDELGLPALP